MKFNAITTEVVNELVSYRGKPCLSIYQPTHRTFPDNKQDPIRFRKLVSKLELSLRDKYPAEDAEALLEKFKNLEADTEMWRHTWDSLAVLASPDMFNVFRMSTTVPETALVADSFYTKPMRQVLQSLVRYQVLGLSRKSVRLFEGYGHALNEIVPAKDVPLTLNEALGYELTEPHSTVASYGGVGWGTSPMHHGQGGKKPQIEIDDKKFFRALDHAVYANHSKPTHLPLILAALPEHHHLFAEVSENPYLLSGKIPHHPDSISNEELESLAWKIFEPKLAAELDGLVEKFTSARAAKLGSDDLEQVARAVYEGRVQTLMLAADCRVSGHLDRESGRIVRSDVKGSTAEDLLDDLGELAALKGSSVYVVPHGQIPSESGLAATFRF